MINELKNYKTQITKAVLPIVVGASILLPSSAIAKELKEYKQNDIKILTGEAYDNAKKQLIATHGIEWHDSYILGTTPDGKDILVISDLGEKEKALDNKDEYTLFEKANGTVTHQGKVVSFSLESAVNAEASPKASQEKAQTPYHELSDLIAKETHDIWGVFHFQYGTQMFYIGDHLGDSPRAPNPDIMPVSGVIGQKVLDVLEKYPGVLEDIKSKLGNPFGPSKLTELPTSVFKEIAAAYHKAGFTEDVLEQGLNLAEGGWGTNRDPKDGEVTSVAVTVVPHNTTVEVLEGTYGKQKPFEWNFDFFGKPDDTKKESSM